MIRYEDSADLGAGPRGELSFARETFPCVDFADSLVCSEVFSFPGVAGLRSEGSVLAMLSARVANRCYFQKAYGTGEHGWAAEEPSPYMIDYLKRLRQVVPRGKVLDIGCGEGRHAVAAARMGFKVTAIDYEPLALQRARQAARVRDVKGILFREADVLCLPFPDGCFDILMDYGCLHHQRKADWRSYRANILRVMKAEGFYLLCVFSPRFEFFRGSGRSWHIAYGAYRRCFTRNEIMALFGGDFEVVRLAEERGKGGGFWHALMHRLAGSG